MQLPKGYQFFVAGLLMAYFEAKCQTLIVENMKKKKISIVKDLKKKPCQCDK